MKNLTDYVTGVDRVDGDRKVTHLYAGTFADPGWPMCARGWNRGGDGYSIFRNNVSEAGICRVCERRALEGRAPVPPKGYDPADDEHGDGFTQAGAA